MKILFLSEGLPAFPCFDGFKLIPYNLIRYLSANHEIYLRAFCSGDAERARSDVAQYCADMDCVTLDLAQLKTGLLGRIRSQYSWNDEMAAQIQDLLSANTFDVIHVEGANMGQYVYRLEGIPKIICPHDSPSANSWQKMLSSQGPGEKFRNFIRYRKNCWVERNIYSQFNHCVVVSEKDKAAIQRHAPNLDITVMTNGVDLEYYGYRPYSGPDHKIVFTGSMSYAPNVDAALFFYREIFPLVRQAVPDARFYIVGASPSAEIARLKDDPSVVVTGKVADIREYITGAAVYACPMRYGTGIKNKVLESMALGTPLVATSCSIAGVPAVDVENILLADSAPDFARQVTALLQDRDQRARLAQNARAVVETHFNWADRARMIEDIYKRIV